MITAVDTNILLEVFTSDRQFLEASEKSLRQCSREGPLVASEVVWAETAAAFNDIEKFNRGMDFVSVSFSAISASAATMAGRAWRHYRASGGTRIRGAADFLIGAHALECADRLLTRDRGFYRRYFSGLRVLDPTTDAS